MTMGLAQGYSGKNPVIVRYTISGADWQQAFSAVAGVRRWVLKLDESSENSFDYRFKSSGDHMTNSGIGISRDNCDLPDIYVRGTDSDVLELEYWG
jgi:hypothetical protein